MSFIAVSGPDAYISLDWYGMEDQVPTWNYVAVHLRGTSAIELMKGHVHARSALSPTPRRGPSPR